MSKLACILTLRQAVATWSDSVLDDAVTFAQAHHDIFTNRNSPVGQNQLYGLMNVMNNAPNFRNVRQFIEHQAQKASQRADASGGRVADLNRETAEFWTKIANKLSSFNKDARSLAANSGLSDLAEADRPDPEAVHRTLAVEYLQHLTAEILFISKQESRSKKPPRRANQPPNRHNKRPTGGKHERS